MAHADGDIGARERGKRERRGRLILAARDTFREKGYAAATTREIAARAGIAMATLFTYAPEKRDLLRMIYRDDLVRLTLEARAAIPWDAPLLEQLLVLFRPRYALWAADPDIARHAMHEVFSSMTQTVPAVWETNPVTKELLALITEIVRHNVRAGAISPVEPATFIATYLLDTYINENRRWLLSNRPTVRQGVARLTRVLTLALNGITPA